MEESYREIGQEVQAMRSLILERENIASEKKVLSSLKEQTWRITGVLGRRDGRIGVELVTDELFEPIDIFRLYPGDEVNRRFNGFSLKTYMGTISLAFDNLDELRKFAHNQEMSFEKEEIPFMLDDLAYRKEVLDFVDSL